MTSPWYEALLIAEKQCVEKGHHDDGRIINVVHTEQAYAPAVCDECLDYAAKIKNDEIMPVERRCITNGGFHCNHSLQSSNNQQC